jgi:hypothetical protein
MIFPKIQQRVFPVLNNVGQAKTTATPCNIKSADMGIRDQSQCGTTRYFASDAGMANSIVLTGR